MAITFPGTTIEVSSLKKGSSVVLFDGIFAAGGITLSQVSVMTGLEPYLIQNWIKRGFVSPPVKRMYQRDQFARILMINMLRETLHLDRICGLIRVLGGKTDAPEDDLIEDAELYHLYVDLASDEGICLTDPDSVHRAAQACIQGGARRSPGAERKLVQILQIMLYAHASATLRQMAEGRLASLE
ncbi:MAG: DUF1836 domain-containing protein [Ruminococcaceae bacterium]|nr:DUF1836 domain-containing protein [Oscillospiraceae bacterium]